MTFPYRFSVGEIAIAIDPGGPFDGVECEIVMPLHADMGLAIQTRKFQHGMMYGVQFEGMKHMLLAFPEELRKRRQPPIEMETELHQCAAV